MSSNHHILDYIGNKDDAYKRGAGGAWGVGWGAEAAKSREGAVIGQKKYSEATCPPLFLLVKWVSRLKWSVNGDLLVETN